MEYRFEIKAQSIAELQNKIECFVGEHVRLNTYIKDHVEQNNLSEAPSMENVPFPDMPPTPIVGARPSTSELGIDPSLRKQIAEQVVSVPLGQQVVHSVPVTPETLTVIQTAGAPHALDSAGFPWDKRIHSANSESKNKDGTWRTRRGVDPELVKQVEAELKGVAYVPPAPLATVQPAVALPVFADVPKDKVQDPVSKEWEYKPLTAPVPASAAPSTPPVAVPTPPNTVAYSYQSFKDNFFSAMTQLINLGKINQPYVQQLTEYYQLKQIWDITKNEVQCQNLFNNFVATGLIHEVNP